MYPFRRADKDIFKTEIGFEYNHQGRSELHLTFGGGDVRFSTFIHKYILSPPHVYYIFAMSTNSNFRFTYALLFEL
jgi:hypothetical protein